MLQGKYYTFDDESKTATIFLKVKAAAKKDSVDNFVEIENRHYLRIQTIAEPSEGKANKAILRYLSKLWKLRQNQLEFTKGLNHNLKVLKIFDIEKLEIEEKIIEYARFS